MSLSERAVPCGPVLDAAAAERAREQIAKAAARDGWSDLLAKGWLALAPVFSAAPYLAALARRSPERLRRTLGEDPDVRLAAILAEAGAVEASEADPEAGGARLRELKADAHLAIALADLGGVWTLDQVTDALSRFADAALRAALALAARAEVADRKSVV